MAGNRGFKHDEPIGPEVIFSLFANPMKMKTYEAVAYRLYTLAGLSKRLGRPKSTICDYLSEMRSMGIVERVEYKESVRYKATRRELLPIIRRTRKAAEKINAERKRQKPDSRETDSKPPRQ